MAIVARKKDNESTSAFLRRFKTRLTQSGLLLEAKRRVFLREKQNERNKKLSKMYRLKVQQQMDKFLKEGLDFETSLKRARDYVNYTKYHGR